MAEIFPKDILLRVSPKLLERYQSLVVAGAGRGRAVPVPYTFTRSTVGATVDRDGVGRKVGANIPRIQWVDLDGDGVRETPGILLEGARTQLVTQPENFAHAAWVNLGNLPTGGQSDPFGGTLAYLFLDDSGASYHSVNTVVTFTGDGTKSAAIFFRAGTAAKTALSIFDNTAATHRHAVQVTWTNGVPAISGELGSGTVFPLENWGGGWWRLQFNATGVIAANSNRLVVYPTGTDAVSDTGNVYVFGANAWDAPFPSSYQGPSGGASPSAADLFTTPFNFGPMDLTVLARMVRPVWADASGSLGSSPGILNVGGASVPSFRAAFADTTRTLTTTIDTSGTDASLAGVAIPAGTSLALCYQFASLATGGTIRLDAGSGFQGPSSAASGFSAFGAQTINIGSLQGGGNPLFGVVLDLIIARGLFTRAEMLAIP
ncbi:MAG TPA: hypothetical protein VNL18_15500 [Gemmatimonadales bacterium]|nr:hypothetical protein [Gemmatimonadales bacterium]